MFLTTIAVVLAATSIAVSVGATWWAITRPASARSPVTRESLIQKARPMQRARLVAFVAAGVCATAGFVLFLFSESKSESEILIFAAVVTGLFCQLVLHHLFRVRALEGIIKHSLPDVYSEIRG
jgi:hypothetical protein